MPPTNEFLEFCHTDTGTNLLTQSEYDASSERTSGNKPGVASSKVNNKALRQSAFVASQLAQFIANQSSTDVLDDGIAAKLLAQMTALLKPIAPVFTRYTNSGTHNMTYWFFIASGSATIGATYTNNTKTFTVKATVASGVLISMTGTGAPSASGTLTKASGTGDATLTFYAMRAPIALFGKAVGAGGGGAGSADASGDAGAGGDGGDTTIGAIITAAGGKGALYGGGNGPGGNGGAITITAPAVGTPLIGCKGGGSSLIAATSTSLRPAGGYGGGTGLIAGPQSPAGTTETPVANSGCGGSGAGYSGTTTARPGAGGGGGGFASFLVPNPTGNFAVTIGAGGSAGSAGSGGELGGVGADGYAEFLEAFQ